MTNSEYELAVKIAGKIDSSLTSATGLTKRELKAIAKEAASSSTSFASQFTGAYKKITPGISKFEKVAKKALKGVAVAATAAGTAVAGIAAYAVNVGTSFESQMSTVKAITGATGDDFQALRDKAKQLGADTKYTATQVGEAMQYMGMAGWKTDQILAGISSVMDLASASGEDLGTVSDIVTDDMTAFGISLKGISTEEAQKRVEHFSDVLAAAATSTNTDVAKMGETFKYAGAVAGALGYSIDDVAVATGLMANAGIKADQAGTSLRSLFTRLVKPTKESQDAIDKLHLSITNSDGSMRSFADLMQDMRKGFAGMTQDEKAFYAAELAGQRGMSGLLAIVNATQSDFDDTTKAIQNCAGATKEMAAIKLDNLQGDVDIFKSALEGLGIEIYDQAVTPMRSVVQTGTSLINMINTKLKQSNWVANFMTSVSENLPTVGRIVSNTAGDLLKLFTPIRDFGNWCIKHPDAISSVLTGIASAMLALKGGQMISKVVSAFTALAGIMGSPVAAGILAVAAAIGGAAGIASAIKKARKAMDDADLAEHFGTIKLSMEDLEKVAKHVLKDVDFDGIDTLKKASDQLDTYKDNLKETQDDLAKLQWKVGIGIELSDDERSQYVSDIQDYIKGIQDTVQQKQYTVDVSIGLLFDDNDPTGKLIRSETDNMFSGSEDKLTEIGKRLQSYVNKAFNDGLLTIDEQKHIQQLQQQMANIQAAMTQSDFEAKMQGIQLDYSGKDLDADTFANLQKEINDQITESTEGYKEAREETLANLITAKNNGTITDEQYDQQVQATQLQYLSRVGQMQTEGQNYMLSSIYDAYKEEISQAAPELQQQLNQVMSDYASGDMTSIWASQADKGGLWDQLIKDIDVSSLSQATKDNLQKFLEQMEPTTEQLLALEEQHKALGADIPQWLSESLEDTQNLKALAGDSDALMYEVGENMSNHPELQQQLKDTGNSIPEAVANGMQANSKVIKEAAKYTFDDTRSQLITQAEKPIDINLRYRVTSQGYDEKSGTTYFERYGKSVQTTAPTQPTDFEKYGRSAQAAVPQVSTDAVAQSAKQMANSVGSEITNNTELQAQCQQAGQKVPEGVAAGIEANTSSATSAARQMWSKTTATLRSLAAAEINVKTTINVDATGKLNYTAPTLPESLTQNTGTRSTASAASTASKVAKHAAGGILTTPHIGMVAEDGPEAVIPLSKPERAMELLQQTAQMLGLGTTQQTGTSLGEGAGIAPAQLPIGVEMPETRQGTDLGDLLSDLLTPQPRDRISELVESAGAGSAAGQSYETSQKIEYHPTLNFYTQGTPSRADVEAAERTSQADFERMMDKYLKNRSRYSF
jgi:TP901 family phage tail tape measure protein